ncbi:hypothetical protein Pmar_PMAR028644 [Perkinsus marinus ATCC 50983]|uniref:Uncharacterized protein n=1 Tax=Perkinsus marinus (strain ATCC 50983 / TXsc) TaxID=423536 RepID=C5K8H2_PERM5|nr:hypothetical protein Pmar_PMAR028644 [Perkinsus marinus ATCC 50983]EER19179.1 hypothetical protein Pmar_PMAR028644 [Perkinsus marinus ATCC 50983]|eukprot:XP_002787383.1 hypothetical protein Pmar_PMAR028644 [Perkinsus marinus ATCC 50983]
MLCQRCYANDAMSTMLCQRCYANDAANDAMSTMLCQRCSANGRANGGDGNGKYDESAGVIRTHVVDRLGNVNNADSQWELFIMNVAGNRTRRAICGFNQKDYQGHRNG